MLRYKEEGCTIVLLKSGDTYRFNKDDYDNIIEFVMAGKTWWQGVSYMGTRCTIKVGEIAGVHQHTKESLALADYETSEEKKEDMLKGEN